jgi:type VI secretion system secreted protein Hcp
MYNRKKTLLQDANSERRKHMKRNLARLFGFTFGFILIGFTAVSGAFVGSIALSGVAGEARTTIVSGSWEKIPGFIPPTSGAPSGPGGRAGYGEIAIVKMTDSSSPLLRQACTGSKPFSQVKISFYHAGSAGSEKQWTSVILMFQNVIISGFKNTGGGLEEVSLKYSDVKWEYTTQKDSSGKSGSILSGYTIEKTSM